MMKLEECEKEIWKYKLLLMKEEESLGLFSTSKYAMTQSLQQKLSFGNVHAHLIESMPVFKESGQLQSRSEDISEFVPDI